MSNYVTLLGAEDVTRAAGRMENAADTISRAFASLEYVLNTFMYNFECAVVRMEAAAEKIEKGAQS